MLKTYYTHDNGNRPFKVDINNIDNKISVYDNENNKLLYSTKYTKIWIGKSPKIKMTIFSKGYGKAFDGNSILIEINNLEYVFIGKLIFSFKSFSPINHFVSPVGNNDYPYPYAIDSNNLYYLLIENVVIKSHKVDDPYDVYYKLKKISESSNKPPKEYFNYDIIGLIIGKDQYNFNFSPIPNKEYDRLIKINDNKNEKIFIINSNKKKIKISKKDFIDINKKWGKFYGFQKIKKYSIIIN